MAEATGISPAVIGRIEGNNKLPTREQLRLLSNQYGASLGPLLAELSSEKIVHELCADEDEALAAMALAEQKLKVSPLQGSLSLSGDIPERKPIAEFHNKVIQGDCLDVMQRIPDKSIDMILCDLPYGTTQNKWDSVIDLKKLWAEYERIIKDNGAIVLTAQGVFTAKLILSNEKLFKYKIVWIKSKATNFLNAKVQPLRKHEDICIFYKQQSVSSADGGWRALRQGHSQRPVHRQLRGL